MKSLYYFFTGLIIQNNKLKQIIFCSIIIFIFIFFGNNIFSQSNKKKPDETDSLVKKIQNYSKKDNIFSKSLKSILSGEGESSNSKPPPDPDRKIIKQFSGKFIRNIKVEILDVFGASVENPDDTTRSWLESTGNSFHINTKQWLIRNMLLFKEGDKITPFEINESERIIRLYQYIYDVRIIPQKISKNSDSIDIIVYVMDIWSINGGASLSFGNKSGSLYFNDINFLGYGNEFSAGIKIDPQLMYDWDWDGSYTVNNIGNTFITSKFFYKSEFNSQHYGLVLSRDFISPIIDWGGGIAQHWENTRYPDTILPVKYAKYNQQDYWLGYAFNIQEYDTSAAKQNRFNVAARITHTVYNQRPEYDTLNYFQDNTMYLARFGYSDRVYYQDNYIFGLGKTEDVPLIEMAEVLFGYENGEFSDRPYLGFKAGYSYLTKMHDYFYGGFQIGSFYSNGEWLNNNAIIELLYFSKLNFAGTWKWRHYVGSRLSYSYNPINPLDILNIDNERGLRGFTDYNLKGNKKLVVNYEADLFVPINLLGFKIAVIFFADLGLISTNNSSLFLSKLFQGYGFGIRVKNEHLIFPTMQFMFGFYPITSQNEGEQFNLFYQSEMFYRFNKFQFAIPSVVTVE